MDTPSQPGTTAGHHAYPAPLLRNSLLRRPALSTSRTPSLPSFDFLITCYSIFVDALHHHAPTQHLAPTRIRLRLSSLHTARTTATTSHISRLIRLVVVSTTSSTILQLLLGVAAAHNRRTVWRNTLVS